MLLFARGNELSRRRSKQIVARRADYGKSEVNMVSKTEQFDLYDINRRPLGQTIPRGLPLPENAFRLVVHVCIFSSDGKMLCQRRQPFKEGWSDMWDVSVGGSVVAGETSELGARRETSEELGLQLPDKLMPSLTVHFDGGFDDWYCVTEYVNEKDCVLQYEEVSEVGWFSQEEILRKISDGSFIPYEESLINLVFFLRNHRGTHKRKDIS